MSMKTTTIKEQIIDASLKIGGETRIRVRLSQLRKHLCKISKKELDSTLLEMEIEEKLVLMALDNGREITNEDEEAAINLGRNIKRHILYLM
jgi:hypothetical protein